MARRVEDADLDGDEEFPSVQELLKSSRVRGRGRGENPSSLSTSVPALKKSASLGKKETGLVRGGGVRELELGGGKAGVVQLPVVKEVAGRLKARKRVLTQKSDNPLLRPLSGFSGERLKGGERSRRRDFEKIRLKGSLEEVGGLVGVGESSIEDEEKNEEVPVDTNSSLCVKKMIHSGKEESNQERLGESVDGVENAACEEPVAVLENGSDPSPTVARDIDESCDEGSLHRGRSLKGERLRGPAVKKQQETRHSFSSDEEDFGEESDDLSDFIVNDSSVLEEEESMVELPPPRSARRLVRGQRPRVDPEETELDLRMEKLTVDDDSRSKSRHASIEKDLQELLDSSDDDEILPRRNKASSKTQSEKPSSRQTKAIPPPSSDIEDPFTLRFSPSMNKPRKLLKEIRFKTPPGSPENKTKGLISPRKLPRIPSTPHRPSMDAFWQQDIVNEWNDEYSPRKTPKPTFKLPQPRDELSEGGLLLSSKMSPVKQAKLAKDAKKAFSQKKHQMAESFLTELDEKITDGQISKLAASTGGVKIQWSRKLNTTAGRANWRKETLKPPALTGDGNHGPLTYRHHASIELAEKVIDDEDRLLNVIAHEFCHLANFMVSGIKTNPHGKEFKAWAAKCGRVFGDRGIEVTTKHSYEIEYKFVWECENCGTLFKRHSKSIDPLRHRCGSCQCKLVQIKPVPKAAPGKDGPEGKQKGMSEYQLFVKENMSLVRKENPGSPQKDIMGLLGKRYQEFKAAKSRENDTTAGERPRKEGTEEIKEGTADNRLDFVARRLNFLDLTRS